MVGGSEAPVTPVPGHSLLAAMDVHKGGIHLHTMYIYLFLKVALEVGNVV